MITAQFKNLEGEVKAINIPYEKNFREIKVKYLKPAFPEIKPIQIKIF